MFELKLKNQSTIVSGSLTLCQSYQSAFCMQDISYILPCESVMQPESITKKSKASLAITFIIVVIAISLSI
jgi:hypothetical protein